MKLTREVLFDLVLVIFAALLASVGYNYLINEVGLFPGGFAGVSFLISRIGILTGAFDIQFAYINIVINMIIVFIFYKYCGKHFTILSIVYLVFLSLFSLLLPITYVTDDILLCAVFGGIILGVAGAITFYARSSSGGTDFIAIFLSRKKNMPIWNWVLGANMIVLVLAGFLFGWDKALYSIILQFTVTQVLHQLNKDFRKVKVSIVTEKPELAVDICTLTHHGVTQIDAKGAFTQKEKYVFMTVVPARLLRNVCDKCREIDPNVFIDISKVERVYGNYYQPPMK